VKSWSWACLRGSPLCAFEKSVVRVTNFSPS